MRPKISTPTAQELFDLTNRVALITGASGHLGLALAAALAEAGCRVIVASRKMETAQKVAAALGGAKAGRHLAVVMDQMDEASIQRGFERAAKLAGRVDILVNNGHEPLAADWRTVNGNQFTRQLANCTGYFLLARLVRDHAVKHRQPARARWARPHRDLPWRCWMTTCAKCRRARKAKWPCASNRTGPLACSANTGSTPRRWRPSSRAPGI